MDTIARLNEFMNDRGMSLTELSERSGISRSTLTTAVRRNTQLSIDTVEKICKGALQIPLYEFFASDEDWKMLDYYSKVRGQKDERKPQSSFFS